MIENVRPMLPNYEEYKKESSFFFPKWGSSDAVSPKKWSLKAFFKRTLGITATSNTLRSMMEMTATRLLQEKKIDETTRLLIFI